MEFVLELEDGTVYSVDLAGETSRLEELVEEVLDS